MEISFSDIILYVVNIVILFVVIRFLLYKPLMKFLGNRSAGIQKQVDEAARKQTEAEQLKSQYDEMMGNAHDLAAQIINRGRAVADEQAKLMMTEAEGQARELKERTQRHISDQKRQAVMDMRREVTHIAIQIAEKVLEREISYEDNKQIIDKFFEKVG